MVRLSVPLSVRRRPPDLYQPTALRREVHIISLMSTLAAIVLLSVSLGLRGWATGKGDSCDYTYGLLSVEEEVRNGEQKATYGLTKYYSVSQQIIVSCVLSISSLTIITSLVAMVISAGFPREKLEFLRHYSVFNVVSLLCIVLIGGLWVWVTELLPNHRNAQTQCGNNDHVTIKFGYAYYMAMGSGLLILLAASLNLLRARTLAERRRIHQRQLFANSAEYTGIYNRLNSTAEASETTETETDFSDYEQLSPPPPYAP